MSRSRWTQSSTWGTNRFGLGRLVFLPRGQSYSPKQRMVSSLDPLASTYPRTPASKSTDYRRTIYLWCQKPVHMLLHLCKMLCPSFKIFPDQLYPKFVMSRIFIRHLTGPWFLASCYGNQHQLWACKLKKSTFLYNSIWLMSFLQRNHRAWRSSKYDSFL